MVLLPTVPPTAPEAFSIATFIRSAEFFVDAEAMLTKLRDVNQKSQSLAPRERTKKHIPCAFLEDAGAQSMQSNRYHVLNSPRWMSVTAGARTVSASSRKESSMKRQGWLPFTQSDRAYWKACANSFPNPMQNIMNSQRPSWRHGTPTPRRGGSAATIYLSGRYWFLITRSRRNRKKMFNPLNKDGRIARSADEAGKKRSGPGIWGWL